MYRNSDAMAGDAGGERGTLDDGLWFGNAVLVAVGAADPVNVVRAFGAGEGRVHLFDVDAAMGHLWMAGLAGGCGALVVASVTGETADAFVDTDGRAVVAGAELRTVVIGCDDCRSFGLAGCVALVAEGLTLIGANRYGARPVPELRNCKQGCSEVQLLATVVEGDGVADRRSSNGDAR